MKELFFDLETSLNRGYFWRPGNKVSISHESISDERKIICAAWKWRGSDTVYSIDWGPEADDYDIVAAMVPVLDEATHIIAQNGDAFDMKWLRGRALFHRIPMQPKYKTIDTLKMCRRLFNLNSYRLDYISKYLGNPGKLPTGFGLWKKLMETNTKKDRDYMVKYCENDVIELEEIYNEICKYDSAPTHVGAMKGLPSWSCAHCGSFKTVINNPIYLSNGTKKYSMKCKDCGKYHTINESAMKARKQYMSGAI